MTIYALSYAFPPLAYPRSVQVARLLSHLPLEEPVRVLHAIEEETDPELFAAVTSDRIRTTALGNRVMTKLVGGKRPYSMANRLLLPDPQRPWAEHAARHFLRRWTAMPSDVLITFGQPMSDHLAGRLIAKRLSLPWVAHFSDPWADSPYRRGGPIFRINRRYERGVIGSANAVVFTSQETLTLTMRKYPASWSSRAHVLPHAYDQTLFATTGGRSSGENAPLVARYLGTFYGHRGPDALFTSLLRLATIQPDIAERLRIELIGRGGNRYESSDTFRALPEGLVVVRGQVGYLESLRLMREADLLLLIDAPFSSSVFLPSKLVEYIGAGKPILALSPPGSGARLVRSIGGWVADPDDIAQITACWANMLDALPTRSSEPWGDAQVRERFAAPAVAGDFAEIIAGARDRKMRQVDRRPSPTRHGRSTGGRLPKVLFVIGSLEPGGSEGQLVSLIEQSHGKRLEASLAVQSLASDIRYAEVIERLELSVAVLSRPGGRMVSGAKSLRTMADALRANRPDVVYAWLEEATLLATPVARLMRVPVMVARRNISGPYTLRSRHVVRAIYAAERLAVLTTANSDAVAAESIRRGVSPSRIRVIRNGYVAPRAEPLPSHDVVTLGYLARMRSEKGHRHLVRALAALETDVPWRLLMGGDGPLAAEIEREVEQAGVARQVEFMGRVSDVTQFWRECDAAVLFSDHEGSPNALIEAGALGRPLVATNVGGIPEFVDDSVGVLVDPADPTAAARALRRIIEDRALRERLGLAAQQRIAERFPMKEFVEGHCAAINEAVATRAR